MYPTPLRAQVVLHYCTTVVLVVYYRIKCVGRRRVPHRNCCRPRVTGWGVISFDYDRRLIFVFNSGRARIMHNILQLPCILFIPVRDIPAVGLFSNTATVVVVVVVAQQ